MGRPRTPQGRSRSRKSKPVILRSSPPEFAEGTLRGRCRTWTMSRPRSNGTFLPPRTRPDGSNWRTSSVAWGANATCATATKHFFTQVYLAPNWRHWRDGEEKTRKARIGKLPKNADKVIHRKTEWRERGTPPDLCNKTNESPTRNSNGPRNLRTPVAEYNKTFILYSNCYHKNKCKGRSLGAHPEAEQQHCTPESTATLGEFRFK